MDAPIIVAICALVVSVVSTSMSVWTAFLQRRHMRLSVRPIAAVPVADYENRVAVYLQNNGLGPMRITSLRARHETGFTSNDIFSQMPELPSGIIWSTFHESVDGATLNAGSRLELLVLEGDPNDTAFCAGRDSVRKNLARLVVSVDYEDLYGESMKAYERSLSFFGRHDVDILPHKQGIVLS